jgi:hypothetical protein
MRRDYIIWVLLPFFWLATTVYGAERHLIEQRPDNTSIAIFVHGFTGDYLQTWGKLPELLQTDPSLDQYDFLFWGYPSSLFRKNEDLGTTGKLLKTEIDHLPKPYDKPYDKIVLIGHSMGGLVIRSYIVQALIDGKGNDLKTIANVMLFGVPNEGDLKAQGIPKWVNDQIADLGVASQFITELRNYWIKRVTTASHNDDFHQAIPTVAVVGYHDHLVSRQSVESFFLETEMTDGDHRSMVKPETTSHLTYRIIHRRLIDATNKPHRRVRDEFREPERDIAEQAHEPKVQPEEKSSISFKEYLKGHERYRNLTSLQRNQFVKVYVGKQIEWEGYVKDVESRGAEIILWIDAERSSSFDVASCRMPATDHDELMALTQGQKVKISGVLTDKFFYGYVLEDCILIKAWPKSEKVPKSSR